MAPLRRSEFVDDRGRFVRAVHVLRCDAWRRARARNRPHHRHALYAASGQKWHPLAGRGEPLGLKVRGSPDFTAYGSHQAVVALPGKPTQADTS
jgi:hypothetical protein